MMAKRGFFGKTHEFQMQRELRSHIPPRDRSNRRAWRTKLLHRRSSPRDSARRCMSPFTKGAPLRHPLFTCWPYANSRIRDRTRPTAIGIQIQISHCEGYPRPLQVLPFRVDRGEITPYTCHPFRSEDTCPPFREAERKGEKRREATERESNNT